MNAYYPTDDMWRSEPIIPNRYCSLPVVTMSTALLPPDTEPMLVSAPVLALIEKATTEEKLSRLRVIRLRV